MTTELTSSTLAERLRWQQEGEEFFLVQALSLEDDALGQASLLPEWTRAHVIAHVARNADALGNLLHWASAGIETPMYRDSAAREQDIQLGATQEPEALRLDLATAQRRLAQATSRTQASDWPVEVRSARGRAIPASEVPWLRVREVWLHAIDLNTHATFADLPSGLVDALLTDVTTTLTAHEDAPRVQLAPLDRESVWHIGDGESKETIVGPASELLGWIIGRRPQPESDSDHSVHIPRWL